MGKLALMGVHEIAEMLGVTRQRVDQLSRTDDDFPEPADTLHSGRVWLRADIEAWAQRTTRTGNRRGRTERG